MPIIRKSPKEVQVDDTIYTFEWAQSADAFEACVATVDVNHCLGDHPSLSTRPANAFHQSLTADPD